MKPHATAIELGALAGMTVRQRLSLRRSTYTSSWASLSTSTLVAQQPDYHEGILFGVAHFMREPRTQKKQKGTTGLPSHKGVSHLDLLLRSRIGAEACLFCGFQFFASLDGSPSCHYYIRV